MELLFFAVNPGFCNDSHLERAQDEAIKRTMRELQF